MPAVMANVELTSSRKKVPNSARLIGMGLMPSVLKRACTSGTCSALVISLCSFSTMSRGVFAGRYRLRPRATADLPSEPDAAADVSGKPHQGGYAAKVFQECAMRCQSKMRLLTYATLIVIG